RCWEAEEPEQRPIGREAIADDLPLIFRGRDLSEKNVVSVGCSITHEGLPEDPGVLEFLSDRSRKVVRWPELPQATVHVPLHPFGCVIRRPTEGHERDEINHNEVAVFVEPSILKRQNDHTHVRERVNGAAWLRGVRPAPATGAARQCRGQQKSAHQSPHGQPPSRCGHSSSFPTFTRSAFANFSRVASEGTFARPSICAT